MKKIAAFVLTTMTVVLALAAPAFAVEGDPADVAGDILTSGVTQLTPVIIALGTGIVTLVCLWFGVKTALRAVRSGGRGF